MGKKTAQINGVIDILLEQMNHLSVRDNFNKDDGSIDMEELDFEIKRTNGLLSITDRLIQISQTQIQVEKARQDLMIDNRDIPLMIGE